MESKIRPASPVFGELLDSYLQKPKEAPAPGADHTREKLGVRAYEAVAHPEQHRSVFEVSQVMSAPVVTVSPRERAALAKKLMRERRLRHLPVVDGHELVGVLSDRDLLSMAPADEVEIGELIGKGHVLTIFPESSIRTAAQVMFESRISALPVQDAQGRLVGIITVTDILRAIYEKAPVEFWA